jgi:hypothetical protein
MCAEMLSTPGAVHPNSSPVTDRGTRGPTCHTPERGRTMGGERPRTCLDCSGWNYRPSTKSCNFAQNDSRWTHGWFMFSKCENVPIHLKPLGFIKFLLSPNWHFDLSKFWGLTLNKIVVHLVYNKFCLMASNLEIELTRLTDRWYTRFLEAF